MTRRLKAEVQFPVLMAACLLAVMLLLVACGGGGSGSRESRLALTQVNGRVDLAPGGGSLDARGLTVRTAAGSSAVAADGRVDTMIFEEGPQYAELLDDLGRTVMLAFASPAEPDFSALSTAKALAFLALAGPWMKEEGRLKLLDEADMVEGFLPLLSAVESRLAANGYLDLADEDIQDAIETIVGTAYAPAASNSKVRPSGVLATPTTASGLSLDTTVDGKLTVENAYLRRVSLFFRRYSHVPAQGPEEKENNPFTRIDLPNVGRYGGITGTLDSYFKGEVAYSPVRTTPALDIPRFPADAKQTTYQVFAIGPGFSSDESLNVPAEIIGEQIVLEVKALFLDAFVVLLANVALPLKGDQVDEFLRFAAGNAVITDIIGNLRTTIPDLSDKLAAGDYYGALKSVLTSAYTSNTILPAMAQLTLDFLWKNTGINGDDYDMLFNGMKGMLEKMGRIDIGFTLADTFLLFHDIARSNRIEHFSVTTTPGKVTLRAAATTIRPDETTKINAIIQDKDPAGVYEYQWSVSPNANYWVEDRTLNGTDDTPNGILVTAEAEVNIRSLVNTDGTALVKSMVFRLDGGRREVGDGEVTITFESQLQPGEVPSTTFTKVTNSVTVLDSQSRPKLQWGFVSSWVVINVVPGKTYTLQRSAGCVLTASILAAGAPVFDPEFFYLGADIPWPAAYVGRWYNLGNGKAGYMLVNAHVGENLGIYRQPNEIPYAEELATEVARQQAELQRIRPKVYTCPLP